MNKSLPRWTFASALAAGLGAAVYLGLPVHAQTAPPATPEAPVAVVEQLKTKAFAALRGGKFDEVKDLLSQAASQSDDPSLKQMANWSNQFESQRETFVTERHKQYDKAVADVHLLIDHHKDDYALDAAARAYLLADDKKAFREEKWVDDLVKGSVARADQDEAGEQWLKALRLYSDLGSVEPANPQWKEKLKLATRRIRLLALYTPDELKRMQEAESADRDEVSELLKPTTQPTTQPLVKKDDLREDGFDIDWHDTLKDIKFEMLTDALVDARNNYYREVTYRDLLIGGLRGMHALATTKGLEKAFPALADDDKRAQFVKTVDDLLIEARDAAAGNDQLLLRSALTRLRTENDNTIKLDENVFVSEFADGAFAELDPFSSVIWPSDLEEFNRTTQGEFSGVGIQIQSDEDGSLKVVSPLEDSPAYRAGIKAGDIITRINGKNAKGITLNQAVKNITGPIGTPVMLTVRSEDSTMRDYTITRETIKVGSIKGWQHRAGGGWDYIVDPTNKIAYVRLTNFTKTTSDDLDHALKDLKAQGARGMILDLRYNPGGLLQAATEVCDKFLKEGVIVSTRPDRETANPATETRATLGDDEYEAPIVVLVNQYSASASEIVSGALKDQKRALIVGERTFGKGSVQMLYPLANRKAYLKLTTSHYYLPSGRCIHREENSTEWGVDPDVTVEMTPEQMRAAIDARQELDVLRDAKGPPAEGEDRKLQDKAPVIQDAVAATKRDPLASDPQLSAALLVMRLELAGAQL